MAYKSCYCFAALLTGIFVSSSTYVCYTSSKNVYIPISHRRVECITSGTPILPEIRQSSSFTLFKEARISHLTLA
jgi:hypothetical protein